MRDVGWRDGVVAHDDPRYLVSPDRDASGASVMSPARLLLQPLIQFRPIRLEQVKVVMVRQSLGEERI